MIGPALQSVLRSGRDVLNAQFAAARRATPTLDGQAFARFLEEAVDPLADAVAAAAPDRTVAVVLAGYELGLELVGKRLLDDGLISLAWRTLGATGAPLIAQAPGSVLASVSNGVRNLATTPDARPRDWIEGMAALAPRCAEPAHLLQVGQVLAWRAGLAHLREGALGVCDALPEDLALAAVAGGGSWATVRERLAHDPWFVPGAEGAQARAVGGFRGFGGLFAVPPRVAVVEGQFAVVTEERAWWLTADAFGATLHSAGDLGSSATFSQTLPPDVQVGDGAVTVRGHTFAVPLTGDPTSAAHDGRTLALTSAFGHAVLLVPLTERT